MLRFKSFESLGLSLAAMTEASDGDFAREGGRSLEDARGLAGLTKTPVFAIKQVHGTRVWPVDATGPQTCGTEDGDGLVTNVPGIALAVRVADCVPVYLFDAERRAIGIVHAGRQGTHDDITPNAVQAMQIRFNSRPHDLHALIGPSAGSCCYQVSEQIAADFTIKHQPVYGRHLDLWAANRQQLEHCGVPSRNIEVAGICTICDQRFHSYRATCTSKRNAALLVL